MLPQDFLKFELQRRIDSNPRYTMRAFSRSLGLNVGVLSSLLSGKRRLTPKMAEKLCEKIGLSPSQRQSIFKALSKSNANPIGKTLLFGRTELDEETFRVIASWHHYGIMQLIRTHKYNANTRNQTTAWIAQQLKIRETEVTLALERLLKLGLLKRDQDGKLVRTSSRVTTANKNLTSAALKNLQKQVREKAIYSLENDPFDTRCMTSMTLSIDPAKVKKARELIDEFQERMAQFLEKDKKECVYQLAVSLFPLQKMER